MSDDRPDVIALFTPEYRRELLDKLTRENDSRKALQANLQKNLDELNKEIYNTDILIYALDDYIQKEGNVEIRYNINWTWREKIEYVLRNREKYGVMGSARDIVNALRADEPTVQLSSIAPILSAMVNEEEVIKHRFNHGGILYILKDIANTEIPAIQHEFNQFL